MEVSPSYKLLTLFALLTLLKHCLHCLHCLHYCFHCSHCLLTLLLTGGVRLPLSFFLTLLSQYTICFCTWLGFLPRDKQEPVLCCVRLLLKISGCPPVIVIIILIIIIILLIFVTIEKNFPAQHSHWAHVANFSSWVSHRKDELASGRQRIHHLRCTRPVVLVWNIVIVKNKAHAQKNLFTSWSYCIVIFPWFLLMFKGIGPPGG